MFLPVLLVRDYGVWGFVVFAVPNVIGAGAMGWVVSDRKRAARLIQLHARALTAFAAVTAVFQAFFLVWILTAVGDAFTRPGPWATPTPWWINQAVNGAIVLIVLYFAPRANGPRTLASLLWIASAGAAAYLLTTGQLDLGLSRIAGPLSGPADLAMLAPVVVFGFLLCPYLDPTFLRAAASQTPAGNLASFSLGFGVLFLAMIVFTLGYVWALMPVATGTPAGGPPPALMGIVLVHMILQLAFTAWVQAREGTAASRYGGASRAARAAVLLACIAVLATLVWVILARALPSHAGLTGGEVVYRCFMSFYGLVFPAYVWLCMIPTRDGHSGIAGPRGRWKLLVLSGAVVLAAPCYWIGFIERVEWWLLPGLAVVLLSRVVVMMPRGGARGG